MNHPPDKPRDDRRIHEGEKPELGGPINEAALEDVTPVRRDGRDGPIADRDRPTVLESEVEKRSNA